MSIDFSHLRCNNISNLCTITGSVRTVEIKLYFKLIIPSPVFFLLTDESSMWRHIITGHEDRPRMSCSHL